MKVRAFRKNYRKSLSPVLSGWSHLVVVVGGSILIALISLGFVNTLTLIEVLAIPVTLLIANFVEYYFHRWPMHHVIWPLKKMYKTHSGKHHRYFTHEFINIECDDDIHEVFATPLTVTVFFFGIVVPLSLLFGYIFSLNVGLLFFATSMIYYGIYEFIHFGCHMPADHFIGKIPFIKRARKRHQLHHNTRFMREWNFNIGAPLMDFFFNTLKK